MIGCNPKRSTGTYFDGLAHVLRDGVARGDQVALLRGSRRSGDPGGTVYGSPYSLRSEASLHDLQRYGGAGPIMGDGIDEGPTVG